MSHFFFIEEEMIPDLQRLCDHKCDGEYMVLARAKGFADIAQYSDKFQNVKIITVLEDKLDKRKELL